jgi:hypothetical protein
MLPHNEKMKAFLKDHGIDAVPWRIDKGSMKGTWRLTGRASRKKGASFDDRYQKWTPELVDKLNAIGFKYFDGTPLSWLSGNGSIFCTFVIAPKDWDSKDPDMSTLPVRKCSIECKDHPEWGTFGVYEDKGEYYEIYNRGGRVLFKDEAEKYWRVVNYVQ